MESLGIPRECEGIPIYPRTLAALAAGVSSKKQNVVCKNRDSLYCIVGERMCRPRCARPGERERLRALGTSDAGR